MFTILTMIALQLMTLRSVLRSNIWTDCALNYFSKPKKSVCFLSTEKLSTAIKSCWSFLFAYDMNNMLDLDLEWFLIWQFSQLQSLFILLTILISLTHTQMDWSKKVEAVWKYSPFLTPFKRLYAEICLYKNFPEEQKWCDFHPSLLRIFSLEFVMKLFLLCRFWLSVFCRH